MHQSSKDFLELVKLNNPDYFHDSYVLDVGSQDINGNNRYLFNNCDYVGLDLGEGRNVDVVCHVADYWNGSKFDTIISSNAFEHDSRYIESIPWIVINLLRQGGLFAFSCATIGTPEHGTTEHHSGHSPFTNDHYKNLTESDIKATLNFDAWFDSYEFRVNGVDLQFWGIKK